MKAILVVLGVLLLVVLLFGGKAVGIRNELVQQREAVNGTWAEVDNALQRRADLIPNLVETVKGFAKQEQEVLNNIANARSALLNARNPQESIEALTKAGLVSIASPKLEMDSLQGSFLLKHTKRTEGKPAGWIALEDWEDGLELLVKHTGLSPRPQLAQAITNEFIPS